jgi:hypothetical protein
MVFKMHFPAALALCFLFLTGCSFPFFGSSPTIEVPPPGVQSSTSDLVESTPESVPVESVTVTNTSQPVPASTPSLQWNLVGVGCLTTTTIEITVSVGIPATGISGVCTGSLPCSSTSPIKYACQLVPHKDGQVYCQGLLAETGAPLTACLQLPGNAQPVCNTFTNFQRYLGGCKCVSLYTDAASCNADAKCVWNAVPAKCENKP